MSMCVCEPRRRRCLTPTPETAENHGTARCVRPNTHGTIEFVPYCSSTTLVPNQPTNRQVWYYIWTTQRGDMT
mgnify:CR=1 FL=1